MFDQLKAWRWVIIAVIIIVLTLFFAWKLWGPKPSKPEVYASAVKQADGSVVAEKKPQADVAPPHKIPDGSRLERVVQVTVRPTPVPVKVTPAPLPFRNHSGAATKPAAESPQCSNFEFTCDPVRVDLSIVRMPDDSRRVVASSPAGEVISAVDIPVEDAKPVPAPKLWAAGITYDPFKRTLGAMVQRNLGPFRVGVEGHQTREGEIGNPGVRLSALLQF